MITFGLKEEDEVSETMRIIMQYDRLFASFVGKFCNAYDNSYSQELERKMIGK